MLSVNFCDGVPTLVTDLQNQQIHAGGSIEFVYTVDLNDISDIDVEWRVTNRQTMHTLGFSSVTNEDRIIHISSGFSSHNHGTYRVFHIHHTSTSYHLNISDVTIYDGNFLFNLVYLSTASGFRTFVALSSKVNLTIITPTTTNPSNMKITTSYNGPTTRTSTTTLYRTKQIPNSSYRTSKPMSSTTTTTDMLKSPDAQSSPDSLVIIIGAIAGFLILLVIALIVFSLWRVRHPTTNSDAQNPSPMQNAAFNPTDYHQ